MTSASQPLPAVALPSVEELLASLVVVRIPLGVRFRGVTEREVALIRGPHGWGEFSPFLEYQPEEASAWLAAAIETAWLGFPAPLRQRVPVNATVPAVGPADVERVLLRYGADSLAGGGTGLTVKVKVAERGHSVDDDAARLSEVRRLAPQAHIRVDANMGWGEPTRLRESLGESPVAAPEDVSRAVDALTRLAEFDLQYAEQPVATVPGLRAVRDQLRLREVPVKIAADESIRRAGDPLRVAREEAADIIIVKYAPLGGARRALRIIEQTGLPAVVSSALDTSVGLSAGVALAAALPSLDYACGLGTLSLAEDDVAVHPLRVDAGVGGAAGLSLPVGSVDLDETALVRLSVSADRRAAWEDRIRACWAHLAAGGNRA